MLVICVYGFYFQKEATVNTRQPKFNFTSSFTLTHSILLIHSPLEPRNWVPALSREVTMASNRASELNGGDDEEAALRRAIAMSLGETLPDEEAGGPSCVRSPGNAQAGMGAKEDKDSAPSSQPVSSSPAALGLDRKKMEEERLARLRKRKAETPSNTSDALRLNSNGPPTRRPRLMDDQPARMAQPPLQRPAPSLNSNSHGDQKASDSAYLPYPKGVVLRTWACGTPRGGDIKIEEVFQKADLELAVLSSFQWDEGWLMSKLNMKQTKLLLIAYAANDEAVCLAVQWNNIIREYTAPTKDH